MPQERVPEFTSMKSEALFTNTLKTIDYDLHEKYANLRTYEKDHADIENTLKQGEKDLEVLNKAVDKLRLEHEEIKHFEVIFKNRLLCQGRLRQIAISKLKAVGEELESMKKVKEAVCLSWKAKLDDLNKKISKVSSTLKSILHNRGLSTTECRRQKDQILKDLEATLANSQREVAGYERRLEALPSQVEEWAREKKDLEDHLINRRALLLRAEEAAEK
ncbi:smc n terminal domain-containing protein, partial [Cystoisospora suis]